MPLQRAAARKPTHWVSCPDLHCRSSESVGTPSFPSPSLGEAAEGGDGGMEGLPTPSLEATDASPHLSEGEPGWQLPPTSLPLAFAPSVE